MNAKTVLAIVGFSLVVASAAVAQEVKIEAKPQAREPKLEIVPPAGRYEQSQPTDREFYPDGPRVEHDPAFIEGLSREYQTATSAGRAGLSGWTSPAMPLGAEVARNREVTGWFALGFSVTWGAPPARAAKRPAQQ